MLGRRVRRARWQRARRGLRRVGIEPALRILLCASISGLTLLRLRLHGIFLTPGRRAALESEIRLRLAQRWVGLLGDLKGVYAKAGQFAATRQDLLPGEISLAWGELRDRVPPLPLSEIREVAEAELGITLEQAFPDFDPIPLGAASIAQVHRAQLGDGTPVAVKIQYPWIASSLAADLRILRWLGSVLMRLSFRRGQPVDLKRLMAEFEAGMVEELDFEREAEAAREIAANLADDPNVQVPSVIPSLSRSRILTMTYLPAINIADRVTLRARGVDMSQVLEIVARAYAKQIFVDGLFHADPHSGNLFVLDESDMQQRPRILFVDFGLHRRLDPELKTALRHGIYALMQRDVDAFLGHMKELDMIAPGAENAVRGAVESMFTRIAGEGGSETVLGASGGRVLMLKDEAKGLLQETPGLQLPNDLLLYAKTLSYLFALAEQVDGNVDMMKISIPYLLRFLAARD
jgi:ubiquinone biosynthesis protein